MDFFDLLADTYPYLLAGGGLVSAAVVLVLNIYKIREARRKVAQLDQQANTPSQRVYIPNTDEIVKYSQMKLGRAGIIAKAAGLAVVLFATVSVFYVFEMGSGPALDPSDDSGGQTFHPPDDPVDAVEKSSLISRIPAPPAYVRVPAEDDSFAAWLRRLPLKPGRPDIYRYNGERYADQKFHYAIVDIDIGNTDIQQCADAVIRLRSEYFFSQQRLDEIVFDFTSGHKAAYTRWLDGYRPHVQGNQVDWLRTATVDSSYGNFREYLDSVFMYAGTYSLKRELKPVEGLNDMQIGDVFIQGGFPGHAVLVVDMAIHEESGSKIFLALQGFTPAQDIHILKNLDDSHLNPWFEILSDGTIHFPQWSFSAEDLMRFR